MSYAVVLLVPGLASVSEGLLHPGETRGGVWSNTHGTWVPDAQRALRYHSLPGCPPGFWNCDISCCFSFPGGQGAPCRC